MIVRPDAMSASKAPSARPLNSWETKLPQVIMKCGREPAAAGRGRPRRFLRLPGLGVVAEVAAERVGLLHERRAGDDLGDFPEVLLVAHLLRRLAAHDHHRTHQLVVFLA